MHCLTLCRPAAHSTDPGIILSMRPSNERRCYSFGLIHRWHFKNQFLLQDLGNLVIPNSVLFIASDWLTIVKDKHVSHPWRHQRHASHVWRHWWRHKGDCDCGSLDVTALVWLSGIIIYHCQWDPLPISSWRNNDKFYIYTMLDSLALEIELNNHRSNLEPNRRALSLAPLCHLSFLFQDRIGLMLALWTLLIWETLVLRLHDMKS